MLNPEILSACGIGDICIVGYNQSANKGDYLERNDRDAAMGKSIKVFCSHSSTDKPRVKAVAEQLATAGIDPWVDQWEIAQGDDIVGRINEGLASCNVGLIFFSKQTLAKAWVRAEVSTLTYQAIEDGKPVIPVMLDADAPVPELLRSRARVVGEDVEQLIDAIYGRSSKPVVAAPRTQARERQFCLRLQEVSESELRVVAAFDQQTVVEVVAHLGTGLKRSYEQFLAASLPGVSRVSAEDVGRQRDLDLPLCQDSCRPVRMGLQ